MDETPVLKSIDLVSEDGRTVFRLKVTDRLVAIRLEPDGKGGWREPHSGHGLFPLTGSR
jgi:hypothetical protein